MTEEELIQLFEIAIANHGVDPSGTVNWTRVRIPLYLALTLTDNNRLPSEGRHQTRWFHGMGLIIWGEGHVDNLGYTEVSVFKP